MTREELEQIIARNIRTNGRGEITARVMAGVLYDFIEYTDTQAEDFAALVQALADAFSALVEELEGKFEAKAEALEAAMEAACRDLLENHFEPWAEALARSLSDKMDETKAAALDAKTAALSAKDKASAAKTAADTAAEKSTEAKTAALGADGKSTEAKAAALAAKTEIETVGDGVAEALQIIRLGNQNPIFLVTDGIKFARSTFVLVPENFVFTGLTDAKELFAECPLLEAAPAVEFVDADTRSMFSMCQALADISDLKIKDTADNASPSHNNMFSFCTALTDVPAGVLEIYGNCWGMFTNCRALESVNIKLAERDPNNNDYYVELSAAFIGCSALRSITIDASALAGFYGGLQALAQTFEGCDLLTSLPTAFLEACYSFCPPPNLVTLQAFDADRLHLFGGEDWMYDLALEDVAPLSNFHPFYIHLQNAHSLTLASVVNMVESYIEDPLTGPVMRLSTETLALAAADTTQYTYDGNTYTGVIALANAKGMTVTS